MTMKGAKEDPKLTEFLANNDAFKRLAMGFHSNKSSIFTRMQQYLDKELLGAPKGTKQIDGKK